MEKATLSGRLSQWMMALGLRMVAEEWMSGKDEGTQKKGCDWIWDDWGGMMGGSGGGGGGGKEDENWKTVLSLVSSFPPSMGALGGS